MGERLAAALVVLARHGVAPDIQELLVRGNPDQGVPPGALAAALDAKPYDPFKIPSKKASAY